MIQISNDMWNDIIKFKILISKIEGYGFYIWYCMIFNWITKKININIIVNIYIFFDKENVDKRTCTKLYNVKPCIFFISINFKNSINNFIIYFYNQLKQSQHY